MLLMIGQSHSSQMLAFQRPRTFDLAAQRPDLAAMTVQIQELTLSAAQTLTPVSLAGRTQSLAALDRKSTRLNSSYDQISYAVFCLKKKKKTQRWLLIREHAPSPTTATQRARRLSYTPLQPAYTLPIHTILSRADMYVSRRVIADP